ncbi:MAG: glucose-1-phosphate adenylyltransferase [Lachnospiraceae bacterium]|nr:glucose-1-phosphate adenylyltransferase [Lachnospiraceae bacterium]
MINRKKCIAMLLAGGQGSRLAPLTNDTAKPVVPFGARYRIIDFPLANCVNSGIDTVGVLTQYQPLELNDYLGIGSPWDLDLRYGGLHVLPPYQAAKGSDWFKGTANAIYQNIRFIKQYNPEYVLILSGDHIYKMDYSIMLEEHIKNKADCTLAVIDVPLEDASRFGIMFTDKDGRVTEFEEKPKHPKSTQASMGVYIFSTDALIRYLEEDEADPDSQNDFGHNIIPKMLADNCRLFTYLFTGYWRDVGTLNSYWASNMDALGDMPTLWLNDPDWRIYYRHSFNHPQYMGEHADVTHSICGDGNEIDGKIEKSVIFNNIIVEEGAEIKDSIIISGCTIKKGAKIEYAILDGGVTVEEGAVIGGPAEGGTLAVIGRDVHIGKGAVVKPGESVTEDREGV